GKQKSVLAFYNLSGGPGQWALRSVTREYGGVSPKAVKQWANGLYFTSRRGLDRVELTALGVVTGVPQAASADMKKYVDLIDWTVAQQSVLETFNGRLYWSVPLLGQLGQKLNNATLCLNQVNSDPYKNQFGWEGVWQGAALNVYGWAVCTVYGQDRLTFCDYNGNVFWLGDGFQD